MLKRTLVTALILTATTAFAGGNYVPTDAERARWTMQDMRSWSIVLSAYAKDHDGKAPAVSTMEELRAQIEPVYILHAPMTDAWGNPYRYSADANGRPRVISAGADGKFDEATWNTGGKLEGFDGDAIATPEPRLFRHWEYK